MMKTILFSIFGCLGLLLSPMPAYSQGHSGIPEIDTLPLYDWTVGTRSLSYSKALTLSALLPGGGQIYGQHPVRGGFLIGLETLLLGLATYSNLVDIPAWRDQAREALDSADALFQREGGLSPDSAASLERQRLDKVEFARQRTQLASQQQDLTRSQFAWAAGLHVYGILDAVEITYLSKHRDNKTRSISSALYRGMLFPGGGQLYNRRYGKFGLLWMTLGASAVSAYSRQEMVSLLNHRLSTARLENGSGQSLQVKELEKDRTLYRKRRNQYFWGMSLFYVYAMLDGMVDAALSDFDAPQHFALSLTPSGAIAGELSLPF
jgi:TM2 domain-containing membrane protein YozV